MYHHPASGCSTLIYLLAKHPILIVGLGLVGAVTFVLGDKGGTPRDAPALVSRETVTHAAVDMAARELDLAQKTTEASKMYEGIVFAESSLPIRADQIAEAEVYFEAIVKAKGKHVRGVHKDGKSYGPSGLTRITVIEILRKIPDCTILGVERVLLTPDENLKLGYLYFLDLVHRFRDVEYAVVAYHIGPTKVASLLRKGKPLPHRYLDAVKKHLKQR